MKFLTLLTFIFLFLFEKTAIAEGSQTRSGLEQDKLDVINVEKLTVSL